MADYSMDEDPEYWQSPQRFRALFDKVRSFGVNCSYFPLGDADNDSTPVAVIVEMKPGFVIMRHAHPCDRFEVIVRGTLLAADGRVLRAGDVMVSKAGELYGPKTAGQDGCTTVEVFGTAAGVTKRIEERADGSVETVDLMQFDVAFAHHLKKD
jgi:anti-sigma factor ChrR (cupin superfamily)